MQAQRFDGIPSKCRDLSPEESLAHFEEMKKGTPEGLRWCIRAKISADDKNKVITSSMKNSEQCTKTSSKRPFVTPSSTAATQLLTTVLELSGRSTPPMTSPARLSIPWRESPTLSVLCKQTLYYFGVTRLIYG